MSFESPICVRLPARLADELRRNAELRGADRSDVVREALRLYLEGAPSGVRPWDRISHLAGAATGGPPDLAARNRERLKGRSWVAAEQALLDTGILVAFLHRNDPAHEAAVGALRAFGGALLTTKPVLTQAMVLLARTRGGPAACLEFFLRDGACLVPSSRASLSSCRSLMERDADPPAAFSDATLVAFAEETDTWTVLTLDRQDFSVFQGAGGKGFEIRP